MLTYRELLDELEAAIENKRIDAAKARLNRLVEALDDRELLDVPVEGVPPAPGRKGPSGPHK